MSKKSKFPIPESDPQTGELNPHYEELTGKPNPLSATILGNQIPEMSRDDWRKFAELQYLRGRLDEQYKLLGSLNFDLHSGRVLDARITKYLTKLRHLDPMAYELYRLERDNITHTQKRNERNSKKSS